MRQLICEDIKGDFWPSHQIFSYISEFNRKCYHRVTLCSFSTGHTETALSKREKQFVLYAFGHSKELCWSHCHVARNVFPIFVLRHIRAKHADISWYRQEIIFSFIECVWEYTKNRTLKIRPRVKYQDIYWRWSVETNVGWTVTRKYLRLLLPDLKHTWKRSEFRVARNKRHAYLSYKMFQSFSSFQD